MVVQVGPRGWVRRLIASHSADCAGGAAEAENGVGLPAVLPDPGTPEGDGSTRNGDAAFVQVAARAYEAGLSIGFAGLFAGEKRRRISVPSYAFERRRYWVESPKT